MSKKPSIVILTGAGISAESGIKTFRGAGGLWENHPVEEVASIDGYLRNPALVQRFYNERRRALQDPKIKPNEAHFALARAESQWPGEYLLVTQNVDNLHERAGSKNPLHMHGELLKVRCQESDAVHEWLGDVDENTVCPCCSKKGILRPHIVWFGEMPLYMREISDALENCDVFVSVGTSGQVYPAAGFVRQVPNGARKVEINMEETSVSSAFDEHLPGKATERVPEFFAKLLKLVLCFCAMYFTGAYVHAEDVLCSDVALYDLKNASLSVKDDAALAGAGDTDALPLKNGVAELKDDPTAAAPDWRYEIVDDFMMRPTRDQKLRVVRVFENHLTGGGSWDRVMVFRCSGGSLQKIWQHRFDAGVTVKRVNEIQFKVAGKKKASDLGIYQWDAKHVSFKKR